MIGNFLLPKKDLASQAHCLVALANALPKPAKELACLTHGQSGIKHETLTAGKVHRLWRTTGDKNASWGFVSLQILLNALQRLRHLTGEPLYAMRKKSRKHK